MGSKLHISDSLALPLDFVTQTQAILAKKGVGKSYTAAVQAEELLKANQQIVIIDPTGAHWGLKSSADGKHPGFPIVIFGGEHADVPLEETAGDVIATALVENRFSAIIDLKLFRKSAMVRFMTAFLETLFHKNREAMHLFVDECDLFAPQKVFKGGERCLGAMEDIVRRGRSRGIGSTLISQRPQVINKDVLTQCEIVCILRLVHPLEINAIHEWVKVHGEEHRYDELKASLPSLPIGEAWFWSPGWGDIFQRVKMRRRETFNSSATPKAGEIQCNPKVIAQIDLTRLGQQIIATVQRQKENDPSELKRKITELQAKLSKQIPVADETAISKALAHQQKSFDQLLKVIRRENDRLRECLIRSAEAMREVANAPQSDTPHWSQPMLPRSQDAALNRDGLVSVKRKEKPQSSNGKADANLQKAERKILTVLAQYPEGRTKTQIAILSAYSSTSGGFRNSLSKLRTLEYLEGENDATMRITDAGLAALGDYDPLPTGNDLRQHWYTQLPKAERAILRCVAGEYPHATDKDYIAENTGYVVTSGGFRNSISKLRTLELIVGKDEIKAADSLFS